MIIKKQFIPRKYRNKNLTNVGGDAVGQGVIREVSNLGSTVDNYLLSSVFNNFFEYDEANDAIKAKKALYSVADISAFGLGAEGGSGTGYDRLDEWFTYDESRDGWVLSAKLGYDLFERIKALESKESDKHFRFAQNTPSAVWNVAHNLNKFPSVTIVDSAGTEVSGEIKLIDNNNVQLLFSSAFSGSAYFN